MFTSATRQARRLISSANSSIKYKNYNRRLQVFKPELVHLHAVVEPDNDRGTSASLNLRLPSGQMAVQRSGENALAATKVCFCRLDLPGDEAQRAAARPLDAKIIAACRP